MSTQRTQRATAGPRLWRAATGALGLAGSLACGTSMILAALGIGGSTAATSMAAMTGPGAPHSLLGALVRIGPWLLAVSVFAVTAGFALGRRRSAAAPALLAGVVLYAGMYEQNSLAVMYAAIAAGYTAWTALYLWARHADPTS